MMCLRDIVVAQSILDKELVFWRIIGASFSNHLQLDSSNMFHADASFVFPSSEDNAKLCNYVDFGKKMFVSYLVKRQAIIFELLALLESTNFACRRKSEFLNKILFAFLRGYCWFFFGKVDIEIALPYILIKVDVPYRRRPISASEMKFFANMNKRVSLLSLNDYSTESSKDKRSRFSDVRARRATLDEEFYKKLRFGRALLALEAFLQRKISNDSLSDTRRKKSLVIVELKRKSSFRKSSARLEKFFEDKCSRLSDVRARRATLNEEFYKKMRFGRASLALEAFLQRKISNDSLSDTRRKKSLVIVELKCNIVSNRNRVCFSQV